MPPQLIASILFELLDLGIRLSDKPEDVEKYIELRSQLRKELVEEANDPQGEPEESFTDSVSGPQVEPEDSQSDVEEVEADEATSTPSQG